MSISYYGFTALTGGGTGALDKLDGATLLDLDMAVGNVSGINYEYQLNATSGAVADGVNIIAPASNAGNKRWILVSKTSGANTGDNVEVSAQAVGFTITKGTTPKTLTVALDASVSGTNTGDAASLPIGGGTLTGSLVLVTGTLTVAPIKMVAGTNLTTPVAGVIEFDGSDYYLTI